MSYFAKRKVGDLERRLRGMSDIRRIVVHGGIDALTSLALVVAVMVMMLAGSAPLAAAFLLLVALYGGLMLLALRRLRPVLADMEEAHGRTTSAQVDLLKGVETVKTLGAETGLRTILGQSFRQLSRRVGRAYRADGRYAAGVDALALGGYAAFVILGAVAVHQGTLSIGSYVAFVALVLFASAPLQRLMMTWDDVQAASVLLARIHDVLAQEPEQPSHDVSLRDVPSVQGHIQLRGVEFRYRPDDACVIRDINLDIEPGSSVAIVGRSGSGKSTLLRVIGALLEPTAGSISVDSLDYSTLRHRELRRRIGYVLQDSYVFAGTVAENIAFGEPDIDLDAVRAAAEIADLDRVVQNLPLGYGTVVGDGGFALSGGEAQRLAVARALYHRPSVLLLDEATSALDPESELAFQHSLARLAGGRTLVVVTHRLMSVRSADLIVVLDQGQIVERGSHDGLMAGDGVYGYLYRLQYELPTS